MTEEIAPPSVRRLESWKAIAAFLARDERTVRRWANELGLPVYRLPGKSRGRVFAYVHELRKWQHAPKKAAPEPAILEPEAAVAALERSGTRSFEAGQIPALSPRPEVDQAEGNNLSLVNKPESSPAPVAAIAIAGRSRNVGIVLLGMALTVIVAAGVLLAFGHVGRVANFEESAGGESTAASPSSLAASSESSNIAEADELYLKGRYYWSKRTPESLQQAANYFSQATLRNPNDARPYVGLADTYNLLREFSSMPESEAYPLALAAAKKAIELDDSLSDAHASLAFTSYWWLRDVTGAEREFARAIELNPRNVEARQWHANVLSDSGRFEAAIKEINRARALDTGSTSIMADKGEILLMAGRYAEAISLLKSIEIADPRFMSPHRYLSIAYLATGAYPDFLDEIDQLSRRFNDPYSIQFETAVKTGYAAGGGSGLLKSMLNLQFTLLAKGECSAYLVAQTFALLRDKDSAFQYLNISRARKEPNIVDIRGSVLLQSLRDDPRYRKLLSDLGLKMPDREHATPPS